MPTTFNQQLSANLAFVAKASACVLAPAGKCVPVAAVVAKLMGLAAVRAWFIRHILGWRPST